MPVAPRAANGWPYKSGIAGRQVKVARPPVLSGYPGLTGVDYTFGWHKKLRQTDEFSSVFHFRCTRRGRVLDVSAGPNQLPIARLGLIVPKKVLAHAVDRNRVRRLIREWFRLQQEEWAGLDIIARLRGGAMVQPLDELALKMDFLDGASAGKACVSKRRAVPYEHE